jgi:Bacterial lectin
VPGPGTHPLTGCRSGATGPVPPNDAAPHGYLRLTDASNDQSAAVLYNRALPANQGLVTTFDQWQYGGTANPPADGISFFLIDGSASLTAPGAFGGSLGYAQKLPNDDPNAHFLPGVDHGYLGVGLDLLGNYFGDWEHRGNGCAGRSPAGTVFRVPAPGTNMGGPARPGHETEGYCFLTATTNNFTTTGPWPSSLPGQLHGPTAPPARATTPSPARMSQPAG